MDEEISAAVERLMRVARVKHQLTGEKQELDAERLRVQQEVDAANREAEAAEADLLKLLYANPTLVTS